MDLGPLSDTCDFLLNALVFAGKGVGYYDWTRPPMFSFIISIPFRMGFISTATIFIVDGIIFIFGVIGLYLLLKLRFNSIESFFGALLFVTFPRVLVILGLGFSDLASVTFSIWALYFLILAVKKDSKFFILSFPFVMMAFLTRYNMALLVFPILLYILMNKDEIKNLKNMLIGIFGSLLLLLPVLSFFNEKFGNVFYPFLSTLNATSSSYFSAEYAPYISNPLFYVDRFPDQAGFGAITIILIILIGLLVYAYKKKPEIGKKLFDVNSQKPMKLKLVLFIVLSLIFIGTIGQAYYLITEFLFFILSYLLYDLTKTSYTALDMDIFVFAWFMAFFIFNSMYVIKNDRYFLLMAPALSYLLVLGLSQILNQLQFKFKKNSTFPVIALILTLLMLLSTLTFLPVIKNDNYDTKFSNNQVTLASEWFTNYDPNYRTKIIYSDLWPYFAWSLKTNVEMMPIFKNNKMYTGGIKNSTFSPQDSIAFNNFLVYNNADYYFSVQQINLTSYKPIKQFANLIVYKRI